MDSKAIMRSLPLVASVLGKRYGVRVEIGGSEAYTDGRTIHLPTLPLDADNTLIGLARGYIDHEAAHIRFTDFDALKSQVKDRLDQFLWNALEDYRVEHAMATLYPGCRTNYNWLIKQLFQDEAESDDFASLVLSWVVRRLRAYDVPELEIQCQSMASIADQIAPGLLVSIESVLADFVSKPRTCTESFAYAQRIRALLENCVSSRAPSQQYTTTTPNTETKEKHDAQHNDEQDDGSPESAVGSAGELAAQAGGAPEESGPINWQGAVPDAQEDILVQRLNSACAADEENNLHVAGVRLGHNKPLSAEEIEQARRATTALKARLAGLLQARSYKGSSPARRGRLETKGLHRLGVCDPRVFRRNAPKQAVDTAVHLLLDISGSMMRDISIACSSCYAVADALQLPGISVGVTAFPIFEGREESQGVCPILRHGERIHSRFLLDAQGTTPLASALWHVLQELILRPEPRKLVLVITDGVPDSEDAMYEAMQDAQSAGVELYGLGIKAPWITKLIPQSHSINNIAELPDAMLGLLSRTL